jgi:hypothetical protein
MTEQQWLASTDLDAMVEQLRAKASVRKLRLFVCACSRSVWQHLHEECQRAVDVAERYADGVAKGSERAKTRNVLPELSPVRNALARTKDYFQEARRGAWLLRLTLCGNATEQAAVLHDIIGNPFRSVALDTALVTTAVTSLAQVAYNERSLPNGELDRVRLAVLADALEEAGCAEQAILDHLRSPGPHVRGCWPVDLVLAKE